MADRICGVRYDIRVFARYLIADVTITNQGPTAINGWTLSFVLPAGQRIVAASGARYDSPTGLIDAHDVGINAVVGPGESVPIRFSIAHSGLPTKPVAFAVNGNDCAVPS